MTCVLCGVEMRDPESWVWRGHKKPMPAHEACVDLQPPVPVERLPATGEVDDGWDGKR